MGAFEAEQPFFGFVLLFGALFIFVYYIRMVNALYFQKADERERARRATDPPLSMLVPILVLAALCLVMGVLGRIPSELHRTGGPSHARPAGRLRWKSSTSA